MRWGVLGTAGIAMRSVIPALQRSGFTPVVAIASRDRHSALAAANTLGIPRAHGSYDALLADAEIDAVYIPLPNHLHVPWSIRAAEAGKHVLCEKPIALNADEARQLRQVRDRTGVLVGEAFMVRAHPRWQRVHELVRSGRVGDLRLIVGHFSYPPRLTSDIRAKPEWGGGALLDIGCYPLAIARWLFGAEPARVIAQIERDPVLGVDRLASGLLDFPGGQGSFTCSGAVALHQSVQIYGTRGRIEVPIPFNPPADRSSRILIDDGRDLAGGGVETIEIPAANQYQLQGEQFSRAIRGEGEVPVTLEDAIGNMTVLDALFRSAESGRWEVP
ncbi:MAG: Gfo/Idh/MocA family oxidoreductase [Gemmatimonadales bacterium]|nr:Gfo/Idh/MocA family oxidoreductase [Gemmatimonadales bacterium]